MEMNDKLYNFLKWVCLTGLPALTTLYGVIGSTFHIPHTQEITTVMVAVDTCLGTLIGVSSVAHYQRISDDPQIDKIMPAIEKWFTEHEVNASALNMDVPEE